MAVSEVERAAARQQSYTGAAVLVFFLYGLFYLPGLVVNYMYFREARQKEVVASQRLPGVGCLQVMLFINVLAIVLGVPLAIGLYGSGYVPFPARVQLPAPAVVSPAPTGEWTVDVIGYPGVLKIRAINSDGTLDGTIYDDPIAGKWDQGAQQITFTRTTSDPNYAQVWAGRRQPDERTFQGTFYEVLNGVSHPEKTYAWHATH